MQLELGARPTSRQALQEIRASGLLRRQQFEVYEAVVMHGPITGMELEQLLAEPGQVRGSKHKRLPELERFGVIQRGDARECRVTGYQAETWLATGALPARPGKPKTRVEAFGEALVGRLQQDPERRWTAGELADLVAELGGRKP